jgi:hypothetical protein
MFVSCVSLCCVGSGLCDGLISRSEEACRARVCVRLIVYMCLIVCDLETSTNRRPKLELGCCATEEKRDIYLHCCNVRQLLIKYYE